MPSTQPRAGTPPSNESRHWSTCHTVPNSAKVTQTVRWSCYAFALAGFMPQQLVALVPWKVCALVPADRRWRRFPPHKFKRLAVQCYHHGRSSRVWDRTREPTTSQRVGSHQKRTSPIVIRPFTRWPTALGICAAGLRMLGEGTAQTGRES